MISTFYFQLENNLEGWLPAHRQSRERVRSAPQGHERKWQNIMYYVYILKSLSSKKLYIGSTEDLKKRLIDHNRGKTTSTKPHRPWELVYYEAHQTKRLARKAEILYKTGQGRKQIKKKLEIV